MEELFLKILNMSITATYVLIAVLVLRLILKRAPKWISYALWSLVLFRLVCPVSISSAFSVFGRLGKTASTGGGLEHIPENIGMMSVPQVEIGTTNINTVINNALPAATPAASANPMQILVFIGVCVWIAGIALTLIYSVVSYLRLKHLMMEATMVSGNIFETDKISSPFVCGLIKPKIYLPLGLSGNEREYVLRHEQTHISRKDYIIKPLAFLVLSVHWFNPFMWLAFILMSRDLEMSCDEKVVSGLDSEGKFGYSSALIQLAMKRPILAGSPLAFGESGAKGRIKNVLNYKKPAFWILIIAVVIAVTAGFTLLTDPIGSASKIEESEIVPLSVKEIEQYNKSFEPFIIDAQGNTVVNLRSHFLSSYYDRPEDINLAECLRYFPAENGVTDEAEFNAIKEAANWPFGADMTMESMPVPVHKFSAGTVNGVLLKNIGIALDDLSGVGMDELIYLESYDAYYNFTSDFGAGSFVCTSGETQGDIIRLYGERATLTLNKYGDSFLFVSHQRADSTEESMPTAYASATTFLIPTPPKLSPKQIVGVEMPELDYADDNIVIFHGYFGMFVYDLKTQTLIRSLDLEPIGCHQTQGSDACEVVVSADGRKVFMHTMETNKMYIWDLTAEAEGSLYKASYDTDWPEPDERFRTVLIETAISNPDASYSYRAADFGNGEYGYLHATDWTLGTLTYVRSSDYDMAYRLFGFSLELNTEVTADEEKAAREAALEYYAGDKEKLFGKLAGITCIQSLDEYRSAVIPYRYKDVVIAFYATFYDTASKNRLSRMIVLTKENGGEWEVINEGI